MNEFFDVLNSNGEYSNKIASREECHTKGLWHKAVVVFIISTDNKRVLLQKRSSTKKLWPNLWDVSAGGHVLTGELGYQAVLRETKEELGIELDEADLRFIGAVTSEGIKGNIINKHFNEFYITHKDIKLEEIKLQTEEVQDIKWIDVEDLVRRIKNNYEDLTTKIGCWGYLIKYFQLKDIVDER